MYMVGGIQMKRLIIINFNALLDEEEAIPVSIMLEIERIRKKGIVFSVYTANTYQEVLDYNRDFPFLDYIISLNSSHLFDVKEDKAILNEVLTSNIVNEITKLYSKHDIYFFNSKKLVSSLKEENIYKVLIKYNKRIRKQDLEKLKVKTTSVSSEDSNYLEITSKRGTLSRCIEKIITKEQISAKDVILINLSSSSTNNSAINVLSKEELLNVLRKL